MNATVKRKFNALVQGIGSNYNSYSSPNENDNNNNNNIDNSAAAMSSPLSMRSTTGATPTRSLTNSDELLKKRRVGGGGDSTFSTTASKFGIMRTTTPQRNKSDSGVFGTTSPSPAGTGTGTGSIRVPGGNTGGGLTTTTSVSNITLRKWMPGRSESPAAAAAATGLPPPKYCPGDREQLLRRLATFQELTDWTPKPDRVNEVEWAKRGWVCQGKERVKCLLCEAELVVKINKKEIDGREISVLIASEIEEGVVRRYAELVVESHREDCLWRKKGCDDSLLRLPLPNPKLALATLRERYDELCSRSAAFLPYEFNLRLPESFNLDAVISCLPSTFFTSNPTPSYPNSEKINRPALALALLGWQGLTNPRLSNAPIPNSASCHTCLRRLGLWMFKSKEIDPETNRVIVPAPMDHLDPVVEHRFFCPWKNGYVQRNPGSKDGRKEEPKSAWEVLVEVLRNESFIRSKVEYGSSNHGRSKSSTAAGMTTTAGIGAKTPERRRPITSGTTQGGGGTPGTPASVAGTDADGEGGEDETRKKKDQDMMSRLRRVKSLFNTKKSGGSASRPGTSHSNRGGE
ncbi:C3HC zinc finger-like-domain-containing protein [Podospora fimiseda]|uniref:C3HC zinc finger-like-domain-containing protein n=1 Tax=Podospora fimiseda TaxID=252190 RepID=A0AAN7BZR2_9PEZI|nr:C3HC zinc finger-like-domain-containing protein [Podospora fimiseda]